MEENKVESDLTLKRREIIANNYNESFRDQFNKIFATNFVQVIKEMSEDGNSIEKIRLLDNHGGELFFSSDAVNACTDKEILNNFMNYSSWTKLITDYKDGEERRKRMAIWKAIE